MSTTQLAEEITTLPANIQEKVQAFTAFLKNQSPEARATTVAKTAVWG